MKIVITGSKGFIGTHVRNSLKNHKIIEWDTNIGKDIKDFTLESDTDFVIHLAALTNVRESIQIPNEYWKQNVIVSQRIFEHYKNSKILYASSSRYLS